MPSILAFRKRFGDAIAVTPRQTWFLYILLGFTLALWPAPAVANAGSALLWTGIIHLLIGNLVIGYIEAGLLSKLFHTPRGLASGVLVLANYASAWAGTLLLTGRLSHHPAITLENVGFWLGVFVVLAFLLTLFIEFPFFWFLLRQRKQAIKAALKATLLIHGLSYLLLLGWYSLNSQTSLITQLRFVPAAQLQPSEQYVVQFMTPDGEQAIRLDLAGGEQTVIDRSKFLAMLPEERRVFGPVPKLIENTDWDYYTNVFASHGLTGHNRTTQDRFSFSLETPFAFWSVSNATHLADDLVMFQLGPDQIYLLHPQTKRIALLGRGTEPIVLSSVDE